MKKNVLSLFLALTMMGGVLSGCGGTQPSQSEKESSSPKENSTVVSENISDSVPTVEPTSEGKIQDICTVYSKTYILDDNNDLYFCQSNEKFELVESGIESCTWTEFGTLLKKDGKYYMNNSGLQSEESLTLKDEEKFFKLDIDEDIVQVVPLSTSVSGIMFLTASGDLYDMNRDATIQKIRSNVKWVVSDSHDVCIIDNDGSGYVYGFNSGKTGILGESDYCSYSDDSNDYTDISKPVKVGENFKELYSCAITLSGQLQIMGVTNDNKLVVMGTSNATLSSNYISESTLLGSKEDITSMITISDNIEHIYPDLSCVYAQKTDGSLWEITLNYYIEDVADPKNIKVEEKKLCDNLAEFYYSDFHNGSHAFLTKDGTLYGFGSNASELFGQGEYSGDLTEVTKLQENVQQAFMSPYTKEDRLFFVTNDNKLFMAGSDENHSVGIESDEKHISTFTEITYKD